MYIVLDYKVINLLRRRTKGMRMAPGMFSMAVHGNIVLPGHSVKMLSTCVSKWRQDVTVRMMKLEAAFFTDPFRFVVPFIISAPHGIKCQIIETACQQSLNRFRNQTLPPVGLPYPVADLSFSTLHIGGMEARQNSSDNETTLRNKLFAFKIVVAVFIVVFIVFGMAFFHQDNKIEHLKQVEWLYRWSRIGKADTEEYQDFERRMLDGKKEERNGMKAKIFNMERNAPQLLYFQPVDDWTPEPPEPPKAEEPEQSTPKAETKQKPLPHEQRSRMTPGEIKAIKDMRANPHIPEDAKPPLPEGY